jgi:hypothetical protein
MNPSKVIREKVSKLIDLPNIGKTVAHDLTRIGITSPDQLRGQDPYDLYIRVSVRRLERSRTRVCLMC